MNKLKDILDTTSSSTPSSYPPITTINRNKKSLVYLLKKLDKDYKSINTDPFIKKATQSIPVTRNLIIKKENLIINKDINTLSDLIDILTYYSNISNAEYNIDLERLQKIKLPLIELNNLVGMADLKNDILDQILFYAQDLHLKQEVDYMHTVLQGPPGTGKTEVAKIIGAIFSQLGILSKKTFKKVVRADLVAGYLGQTALKTSRVIEEALGGVLFIDEAYALGNAEKRDSFAKECIDTLCEALSNHKDKLMVIIAGYENELNDCFFSYNPGLKSRFPWVFKTDKYTPLDLQNIFDKKVKNINWSLDETIDKTFFQDNIKYFPFYGRDMEILLLKTKIAHARRIFGKPHDIRTKLTKEDLYNGLKLFKKHNIVLDTLPNYIGHLYG